MTLVLRCTGLQSGYGDTIVLAGLSTEIGQGDIYALVGKNGAGKSTYLKTLVGLLPLHGGKVELFGHDLRRWRTDRIIAAGISYAPQDNAFFTDLTVDENLRLAALHLAERAFRASRDRVIALFPFMSRRLRQRAGTLSGGEQAMVKVARALLPEPRLVLLDEVSEGLQPLAIERVREALASEHAQRQITILLVEQNLSFVASIATRFGMIERGRLIGEGTFCEPDAAARIERHLTI
jgi:branched-chain amino acid transport system ATP-binding protein